jgi:hypothetical protein
MKDIEFYKEALKLSNTWRKRSDDRLFIMYSEWVQAKSAIDSEREMNALLTQELQEAREIIAYYENSVS